METAKRLAMSVGRKLAITVLVLCVSVGIPLGVILVHLSEPATLKTWLDDSGTYRTLIDETFNMISYGQEQESQSVSEKVAASALDQEALTRALRSAISVDYVQSQFEEAIDGTYDWLEQRSERPKFNVGLAGREKQIRKALSAELNSQISKLPTCTQPVAGAVDVFELQCIPPGVSVGSLTNQFVDELISSGGFIDQVSFNGKDLLAKNNEEGGLTQENLREIPKDYATLLRIPAILLGISIAAAVIAVALSRPYLDGIKRVGISLVSASALTFIVSLLLTRIDPSDLSMVDVGQPGGSQIEATQRIVEPFMRTAIADVAASVALVAGFTLASGLVLILGSYLLKKRLEKRSENDPSSTGLTG